MDKKKLKPKTRVVNFGFDKLINKIDKSLEKLNKNNK